LAGAIHSPCHIPPDVHGGYIWFDEPHFDILGRLMTSLEPSSEREARGFLYRISASHPLANPVGKVRVFRKERCE